MDLIKSHSELGLIVKNAKDLGEAKVTNYFPNPPIHNLWINEGKMAHRKIGTSTFIIHDREFYREIFFLSDNLVNAKKDLAVLKEEIVLPAVVEIISKESFHEDIYPTAVLKRMTRVGHPLQRDIDGHILLATLDDINDIRSIFASDFNAALERVPNHNELSSLIENGCITLYKSEKKEIVGFVIYERQGKSLHLRYWWVSPCMRNVGVGSSLMSAFFCAGDATQRQYLWVFDDNENAIKRYRHYGFEFDGMIDAITLIN